jgi:hypothetical protein
MLNREELVELKANQSKIDELETLSLLQKDFLKLVYWACKNYGKYIYSKTTILKKYDKIKDDFDIEKEVQFLLDNNIIYMETKRTIFKGEYKTLKNVKINNDIFNLLINV